MSLIADLPGLLRRLRSRSGLSRPAAATRAGISKEALGAYERGERSPQFKVFEQLLAAYGVATMRQLAEAVDGRLQSDELRETSIEHLKRIAPGKSPDYYRGLAEAFSVIAEAADAEKPKT